MGQAKQRGTFEERAFIATPREKKLNKTQLRAQAALAAAAFVAKILDPMQNPRKYLEK